MRTFRLLGMALIAILVSVNFASCSSDDDEENNASRLIGTWYEINSEEEQICFSFKSDYTGYTWANHYGESESNKYKFTWKATDTEITIEFKDGKDAGIYTDPYTIDEKGLLHWDGIAYEKQK